MLCYLNLYQFTNELSQHQLPHKLQSNHFDNQKYTKQKNNPYKKLEPTIWLIPGWPSVKTKY